MKFKIKNNIYNEFVKTYAPNDLKNSHSVSSFVFSSIRWNKNFLMAFLDNHLIHYPTPINLTYAWSFGSSAGICLIIQILTGIFLAMHYHPHVDYAFVSVEHIMRNVPHGWLLRYTHANGASMFFIVVYCHIFRGMYYGSYMHPRRTLWVSGVVIYILMMATAFIGYVLPWGQMGFWGATVITNMITILPYKMGEYILEWLWGGYTVNNPTLKRFFVLHFVLPFVLAGLTLIHLALLHEVGSNNPIGIDSGVEKVPFYPYFFVKDLFAFFCLALVFAYFVFFDPNYLGHPINYIKAERMRTPAHVAPEWYFLPYYSMLKSIPSKTGGILAMFSAIMLFFSLPYTDTSEIRSATYRPVYRACLAFFIIDIIALVWVSDKDMSREDNYYIIYGQIFTFCYFFFFLVLFPLSGIIETKLVRYKDSN